MAPGAGQLLHAEEKGQQRREDGNERLEDAGNVRSRVEEALCKRVGGRVGHMAGVQYGGRRGQVGAGACCSLVVSGGRGADARRLPFLRKHTWIKPYWLPNLEGGAGSVRWGR